LGSSAALSDQKGDLVEEMAYYPYGALRHSHRLGPGVADYSFSQKERDRETQWDYFEARYYLSSLARFTRPDPLTRELSPDSLLKPQMLNSYAYCSGQPLSFRDPSGMEEEALDPSAEGQPPPTRIQRIKAFFKRIVNFEKKGSFKIGPVGIDNEGEASVEYGPAKVAMKNTDEGLQYEASVGVKKEVETPFENVGLEVGAEASATLNIQPDANKKTIGSVWAGIKAFVTAKLPFGGGGEAVEGELAGKAETDKYVLEFRSSEAMRVDQARKEAALRADSN
jgi:RHS repeat-associated protein